tara:strand:- start:336 stop:692 length:357 start_codon:yes stop_codon:yes gene_type:complete
MARFILDVNQVDNYKMTDERMKKIVRSMSEELLGGIFRIVCIDKTTDSQFHENESKNKLSNNQINNYNQFLVDNYIEGDYNCDRCNKKGSFLDSTICGVGENNLEEFLCNNCINEKEG